MEGPTPVSALIHAATMVTAGVFLIIRSADLFVHCSAVLILMGVIRGLTAFFAGTVGLVQGRLQPFPPTLSQPAAIQRLGIVIIIIATCYR